MLTINFFVVCEEVYRNLFDWVAGEGLPKESIQKNLTVAAATKLRSQWPQRLFWFAWPLPP